MKRLALLLAVIAFLLQPSQATQAQQGFHLTILHTSENHGHWEPSVFNNVSQGGIARRATLVKQLRGQIPNLLLLDSGDIAQGTLYFVQHRFTEARDLYNMAGYDAVSLGNHEFDLGPAALAENFLSGARFAAVLANVDVSREPALAGKIPPFVVKKVGGENIGMFGLVTEDFLVIVHSQHTVNLRLKDTVQTAREMVATLEGQGVNKIILLSHLGYQADMDLGSKVNGIDVIVSGHTDTLLGDPAKLDASLGRPVGPYPSVARTPSGGRTLVVHALNWGRLLGRLDLLFDDKGVVQNWVGEPILVGAWLADDSAVAAKLKELEAPLLALRRQVIGQTAVDLIGDRAVVRNQEVNFGNLIADAMLWATQTDRTQIALMNGGAIRATIPAGEVSFGQVLDALPFGNRLTQMDISGADLLAALENGVSRISPDPGESAGRFLQVAGLRFSADLTRAANSRITEAQVRTTAGFVPLDRTATYRVVVNDFMASGGDGFTSLTRGTNVRGGDVPLDLAVSDYIKANSPVSPALEGRLSFAGSLAPVTVLPNALPATGAAPLGLPAAAVGMFVLAVGAALRRRSKATPRDSSLRLQ